MSSDVVIKLSVIITLGLVLISAMIILGLVAIHTDRDVSEPVALIFIGMIILGLLGGISWWRNGHRWHIQADNDNERTGMFESDAD